MKKRLYLDKYLDKLIISINAKMKLFTRHSIFLILVFFLNTFLAQGEINPFLYNSISTKDIKYRIVKEITYTPTEITSEEIQRSWADFTNFDWDIMSKGTTLLIGTILPDKSWHNPAIYINAYFPQFEVYLDSKIIYQYNPALSSKNDYNNQHIIELDSEYCNKPLIIVIPVNKHFIKGDLYELAIGSQNELIKASIDENSNLYRKQIIQIIVSSVILFTGIASLFIFFYQWKKREYPFLFYGLFTFASIAENIDIRLFHLIAGISPVTLSVVELAARNALLIFFVLFVLYTFKLYAVKSVSYVLKGLIAYVAITFGFFFWQASHSLFSFMERLYALIGIISICICIYEIIKSEVYRQLKNKFFFHFFSLIFLIISLYTAFSIISIEYHREAPFIYGILSLSFAMISLLVSNYIESMQRNLEYKVEIEVNKNELLKLRQSNIEAQFETLKSQINPHFLFNSLSALSSLCYPNSQPLKAKQFIDEFSNIFRYVLEVKSKNVVELNQELEFVRSFFYLQQIRFVNGLVLKVNIDEVFMNYLVPPLSLQTLVENAIKHNIVSKEKPLTIEIFNEREVLIIRNNFQKRSSSDISSTKTGLQNIIERYRLLTDLTPEYYENENYFVAKIPLLKDEQD
jgi:sensor histidine kinase YesM